MSNRGGNAMMKIEEATSEETEYGTRRVVNYGKRAEKSMDAKERQATKWAQMHIEPEGDDCVMVYLTRYQGWVVVETCTFDNEVTARAVVEMWHTGGAIRS